MFGAAWRENTTGTSARDSVRNYRRQLFGDFGFDLLQPRSVSSIIRESHQKGQVEQTVDPSRHSGRQLIQRLHGRSELEDGSA